MIAVTRTTEGHTLCRSWWHLLHQRYLNSFPTETYLEAWMDSFTSVCSLGSCGSCAEKVHTSCMGTRLKQHPEGVPLSNQGLKLKRHAWGVPSHSLGARRPVLRVTGNCSLCPYGYQGKKLGISTVSQCGAGERIRVGFVFVHVTWTASSFPHIRTS